MTTPNAHSAEETRSNISLWQRKYDRKLLDLEFHFTAGPLRVVPIPHHWDLLRRKYVTCIPRREGDPWMNVEDCCRKEWDERKGGSVANKPTIAKTSSPELIVNSAETLKPVPSPPVPAPHADPPGKTSKSLPPLHKGSKHRDIYARRQVFDVQPDTSSDFTGTTVSTSIMRSDPDKSDLVTSSKHRSASAKSAGSNRTHERLERLQAKLVEERSQRRRMEQEVDAVSKQLGVIRRALQFPM